MDKEWGGINPCFQRLKHPARLLSMNETEVIEVTRQALMLTIQISLPVMMVGLLVGVSIALVQALTQVQEITLVFVPKIVAIFLSMFFFLPWMENTLVVFMESLAERMISGGG